MTPPIPDDALKEIQDALFADRKIQAVKRLREATGQGLFEAKTAVEAMEVELRAATPEKFLARKAGCLGVLAVMLLLSGVAVVKIIA
jgi:hypothetical protein